MHRRRSAPFINLSFIETQQKQNCFTMLIDRSGSLASGYNADLYVWEDVNRCHGAPVLTGLPLYTLQTHHPGKSITVSGTGKKVALPQLPPKEANPATTGKGLWVLNP